MFRSQDSEKGGPHGEEVRGKSQEERENHASSNLHPRMRLPIIQRRKGTGKASEKTVGVCVLHLVMVQVRFLPLGKIGGGTEGTKHVFKSKFNDQTDV